MTDCRVRPASMRPRHRAAEYPGIWLLLFLSTVRASMRPRHRAAEYDRGRLAAHAEHRCFNEAAA